MKRGGIRASAGRYYSPWDRVRLAERYAELKFEFLKAGRSRPAEAALIKLHDEEHPDGGDFASTKRLCIRGRQEEIFFSELDAKRHNREPLSDFELGVLDKLRRRWPRRRATR